MPRLEELEWNRKENDEIRTLKQHLMSRAAMIAELSQMRENLQSKANKVLTLARQFGRSRGLVGERKVSNQTSEGDSKQP